MSRAMARKKRNRKSTSTDKKAERADSKPESKVENTDKGTTTSTGENSGSVDGMVGTSVEALDTRLSLWVYVRDTIFAGLPALGVGTYTDVTGFGALVGGLIAVLQLVELEKWLKYKRHAQSSNIPKPAFPWRNLLTIGLIVILVVTQSVLHRKDLNELALANNQELDELANTHDEELDALATVNREKLEALRVAHKTELQEFLDKQLNRLARNGKPVATRDELNSPYVKNRTVYVADIPRDFGPILDKTFEDCYVVGPAVFWLNEVRTTPAFVGGGMYDTTYMFVSESHELMTGVLRLDGVTFKNCDLNDIALAVPEDQKEDFLRVWHAGVIND